jgi:hypothetical protein
MRQATILNVDRAGRRFALMGFARGAARVGFLIAMIAASAAAVEALFAAGQSRAILTQATVGYLLLAGSFFVVAAALAWDDGSWPVVALWLPHLGLSILMLATQSEICTLAIDPQRNLDDFLFGMAVTGMQAELSAAGTEVSPVKLLIGLTLYAEIAVFAFALVILAVVVLWRRVRRTGAIPLVSERFWISHALGASPGLAKIRIRRRSIPLLFFLGTFSLAVSIGGTFFFPQTWESLVPVQSEIARAAIWLGIWTVPLLGGVAFLELAERRAVTSAGALVSIDSRPPVLFLRSFQDDRLLVLATWFEVFTWLMTGLRMSVWNDFARVVAEQKAGIKYRARDLLNEICRRRALEDILLLEFSNYGPIVAIGDPRHKTRYFGAAREFHEGEEWRQAVVEHMRKSRAIIIALDESEGVGWELETLAREGLLEKTLFLCPARFQSRDSNRALWRHVRERLSRGRTDDAGARDLDQGADARDPVLACWISPDGRDCVATAQKFSYNRYYVTLRWFFRSRWGEMKAL